MIFYDVFDGIVTILNNTQKINFSFLSSRKNSCESTSLKLVPILSLIFSVCAVLDPRCLYLFLIKIIIINWIL
jgi:hypothetical protein